MVGLKDIVKGITTVRTGAAVADQFGVELGIDNGTSGAQETFSINKFTAKLGEMNGHLKTNRFLVGLSFGPKSKVPSEHIDATVASQQFGFLAANTSLPGMSFTTTEVRRYGSGGMSFYPSNVTYPELSINFNVDGHGKMIEFIHAWFNTVVWTGQTQREGSRQKDSDGAMAFELYYKEEFEATMTITVYDEINLKIIQYEIVGVVPSSIGDVTLEWGSEEALVLPCTFRFDTYRVESIHHDEPVNTVRGMSILDKISKSYGLGQTILGSLRTPQSVGDAINIASNALHVKNNLKF